MKKLYVIIFISITSLFLTACSVPILTTDAYIPQNYVKINNSVNLGKFTYLPAELGIIKANEVENTAIDSFMVDMPIAELVKKATALELRQSGIELENGKIVLEGQIKKLKIDDIGFSVDWNYAINYKITNTKKNTVLLDKEYIATMTTTKFVTSFKEVSAFLNKIVALGFDKFINDYDARKVLENSN